MYISPGFDKYWYKALQAKPLSKRKFHEEWLLERHTIYKKGIKLRPIFYIYWDSDKVWYKECTQKFIE